MEIKKYIPGNVKIYDGYYTNNYIFKYNCCGEINGKSVDYFSVVTFLDSPNILTMYPNEKGNSYPFIDLNYFENKKDEYSRTRKSAIDKFNDKYSKMFL